jgi:hypothetical protein
MHFRHRGNNVQIVRSQTDPATGKRRSVPIGSINKTRSEIPAALRQACSPEEIAEIETWLAAQRQLETLRDEVAARTLAEQIERAANWLQRAEPAAARQVFDELAGAWQRLRRAAAAKSLA